MWTLCIFFEIEEVISPIIPAEWMVDSQQSMKWQGT